jgi:hypothetical protein
MVALRADMGSAKVEASAERPGRFTLDTVGASARRNTISPVVWDSKG